MIKERKNVSVSIPTHARLRKHAFKKKTSIAKLIDDFSKTLTDKKKESLSGLSDSVGS